LRSLVKKSIREWDLMLAHAEFTYNRSTSQTTSRSPFEVVYGKNPTSLLDLTSVVIETNISGNAEVRA